jgi:chemotaxis protein methyltransferase CheR
MSAKVMISAQRNTAEASAVGSEQGEFLLTQRDFDAIRTVLYESSGITLSESKTALVYSRLAKRLRALGMESFRDYCALIASDQGATERMTMLAALTTNVTHFFREPHHFEHLKQVVLPPLLERVRRGERIRIWSAGCSAGHEPYSIALTILSLMPNAADYDIRILASDIDPNVIATGRAGIYDAETLSPVPKELFKRWFSETGRDKGLFEVANELKQLISFRELNLIGEWPMRGQFQLIVCRNVTIYFDQPTREKIWSRFSRLLTDDAWLYLGHSERLSGDAADVLFHEGVATGYKMKRRSRS